MGRYDSSKTRVAPVFDQLLARDPSGASWLGTLMRLSSDADATARVPDAPQLKPGHPAQWGAHEASLSAPLGLLEHLVQYLSADAVRASTDSGDVLLKRRALAQRDAATIAEALELLRAGVRGRGWHVLEGPSRPDALLETEELVLCIEGKRTEAGCTTHTQWMPVRSQLLRHMDAAMEAFPHKRVYGMLIVEGDATGPSDYWRAECAAQVTDEMVAGSLPHRSADERERLRGGVLGVTTWQAVCAATGIDWGALPDTV